MQENTSTTHDLGENNIKKKFVSTRIRDAPPDTFDPNEPRIGRRESEPHSAEVSYLFDVLQTNFPNDRVIWDLHHYFMHEGRNIDLQFDISYFKNFKIDYSLSSYKASKFNNRIPDMAINILSKSTWRADVGEHVDYCRMLKIPKYILFCPYHVAKNAYKPPFLRVYTLQENGDYHIQELRKVSYEEGNKIDTKIKISFNSTIPFDIGLIKRKKMHEGDVPLYRMVLLNQKNGKLYQTKMEIEKMRADEEKKRADEEKKRADEEKKRANEEKKRADELESHLKKYKEKFGDI